MENNIAEQAPQGTPWLKSWTSLPERQQEAPQQPQESSPWNKVWSSLPSKEDALRLMNRGVEAVQDTYQNMQFNTVFENLIQAESRGKHFTGGSLTTSPVGAKGITQVMPKTGQDPGYGVTPLQDNTEEEYRRFGKDYLNAMVKEFGGDFRKAVAAYNAGPGNIKKAVRKAEEKGGDWVQYLPKKSETIPYMKRILGDASIGNIHG